MLFLCCFFSSFTVPLAPGPLLIVLLFIFSTTSSCLFILLFFCVKETIVIKENVWEREVKGCRKGTRKYGFGGGGGGLQENNGVLAVLCRKVVEFFNCLLQAQKQNRIQRRGASFALTSISLYFGRSLPQKLPKLWEIMVDHLKDTIDLASFGE
jgi:hypothetical protein